MIELQQCASSSFNDDPPPTHDVGFGNDEEESPTEDDLKEDQFSEQHLVKINDREWNQQQLKPWRFGVKVKRFPSNHISTTKVCFCFEWSKIIKFCSTHGGTSLF